MIRRDDSPFNSENIEIPLGYSNVGRTYTGVSRALPNLWVRMARNGNNLRFWIGNNESEWLLIGEDYFIGMPSKLMVGTYATTTSRTQEKCTVEFAGYRNSITNDGAGPIALSTGTLDMRVVGILFDEPLDSGSVVPENFSISTGSVRNARVGLGGTAVYLDVDDMADSAYSVNLSNIRDSAGNHISPGYRVHGTANTTWTPEDTGNFADLHNRPQPGDDPYIVGETIALSSGENITMDIIAGGSNMWNKGDFGHFIHTKKSGDFDIQVRVDRFDKSYKSSGFGHCGLWIRNSSYIGDPADPDAPENTLSYGNMTYAEGNVERTALAMWKNSAGENYLTGFPILNSTRDINGINGMWGHLRVVDATGRISSDSSVSSARWLRLKRSGNLLMSMWSYDGINWIENDSREFSDLGITSIIGFMETTDTSDSSPHIYNSIRISHFGNFNHDSHGTPLNIMKSSGINTSDQDDTYSISSIPAGWSIEGSSLTGTDSNSPESLHFVYEEITGDFDRKVRVLMAEESISGFEAGLMVRSGLQPNDSSLKVKVSTDSDSLENSNIHIPASSVNVMMRSNPHVSSESTSRDYPVYTPLSRPYLKALEAIPDLWLRIFRTGNHFRIYISRDGYKWKLISERYLMNLPDHVLVGTYASSGSTPQNIIQTQFTHYGRTSIPDGSSPMALSAGTLDKKTVGIRFSEPLSSSSVSPSNFVISDGSVTGTSLGLGGESVYLDVSGMTQDNFSISISNITDASGNMIELDSIVSGSVAQGWFSTDIGTIANPFSKPQPANIQLIKGKSVAISSGDSITLDIIGADPSTTSGEFQDSGHFVYRKQTGDFLAIAQIRRFDNAIPSTANTAHAGLWVRNSLYRDGMEYSPDITKVISFGNVTQPDGIDGIQAAAQSFFRDSPGADYIASQFVESSTPDINGTNVTWGHLRVADAFGNNIRQSSPATDRWLSISRKNNSLSSSWSYNGIHWTEYLTHTSHGLASSPLIGFLANTGIGGNPDTYVAIQVNLSGEFPTSAQTPAIIHSIHLDNSTIIINFTGILQSAIDPAGPWSDVSSDSPYSPANLGNEEFFRSIPLD